MAREAIPQPETRAFEEAFDIEILDEDAEKIRTVKDATEYIEKHSKGGK